MIAHDLGLWCYNCYEYVECELISDRVQYHYKTLKMVLLNMQNGLEKGGVRTEHSPLIKANWLIYLLSLKIDRMTIYLLLSHEIEMANSALVC